MHNTGFDLRHLEAFAAIMSAGSVTGGARILGKSQPSVSRTLLELEATLGQALFHRSGPRIVPTKLGVALQADVERLFVGLRHIRARADASAADLPSPVAIVATPALAAGLVPLALAALPDRQLPKRINLQALSADAVIQSLLSRTADIGVASAPFDAPGIETLWAGEAPCIAVLRTDDPLAAHRRIALGALRGRRIVTLANPNRLRRPIEAALKDAGVPTDEMVETNASHAALALVRAGIGVAILEPASAFGLAPSGIAVRPVVGNIPFHFGAIAPAGTPLSTTAHLLVGTLRAAAGRLPGFKPIEFPTGRRRTRNAG
jgi:DNA-binding transcriptional LysR family regulator